MLDEEIEQLYVKYGHYLFTRCKRLLDSEDEAYDALQEVFVRLVKTRPSFDPKRTPLAWLNRVTTNLCLNRIRARRYRQHPRLDDVRELADCAPHVFIERLVEHRQLLCHLLGSTDTRTQQVVMSYFLGEQTAGQIGSELGVSAPTVRRIIKRFLAQSQREILGLMTVDSPEKTKVYR